MFLKSHRLFILVVLCSLFQAQAQTKLALNLNKKGAKISPTHYGIFFEDINHAADGGLYAELIRNRSFEDAATPDFWSLTNQTGATATLSLDSVNLLNSAQSRCLKLSVTQATSTARAAVANDGFWGVNIVKGKQYTFTFFAKRDNAFPGTVTVSLESTLGTQYAKATISGIGTEWAKYSCTLSPLGSNVSGKLMISANAPGTIWMDVVSLFPPTFKNRQNGLRPDLAQLLVDLKPKFMRFPGGCFIEGDVLANRFQWKNTIGNIETRPGHVNLWGYRTSDGMGFHEFLQLSEDLGAEPLYVINVGLAHNNNQPYTSLNEYIQDAMDALEYANGDASTTYGAKRVANGHPEPFNIKFIEIGNENYHGDNYGNRYIQFYNAIKAKYPNMQCIGNVAAWGTDNPTWTFSHPVELLDEHYYRNPQWFINQYYKYDTYSRTGPKIYAGEYAVTSDCGLGNLNAALGEAVYMSGMEKNSDVVPLNSYAPIFVHVNDRKWSPDMIDYDASSVYCTPSYYVQKLYANNIGTVNVLVNDSLCKKQTIINGSVGVGSWSTKVDYTALSVTSSKGTALVTETFADATNWTTSGGTWKATSSIYTQSSTSTNCRAINNTVINDSVYSYTVNARKTSGSEGFLVMFGYKDSNNFYWWNIGGWANTVFGIEQCVAGTKSLILSTPGSITTNKWYTIRIDISKTKVLCYLDNVLIHTLNTATPLLYTSATLDETDKQLYLKVVNTNSTDVISSVSLAGLPTSDKLNGSATVLTSALGTDENTLANPSAITPITTSLTALDSTFNYTFKANSLTTFKINTSGTNAVIPVKKPANRFSIYPTKAKDNLYIRSTESGRVSVDILNQIGTVVIKQRVDSAGKVNLSSLKSGMYVARLKQGGVTYTTKFVKE